MSASLARRLSLLPLLVCLLGAAPADDDLGAVGDFALTERDGRVVRRDDLLGKVWVASFVFTRCTAGCPQITATMALLQDDLRREPDVRLVTFTVDPEHDDPQELSRYAEHFGADPRRWLFLTGDEKEIRRLLDESFHLPARKNTGDDYRPGNEFTHSSKLVLVDRRGHVRGYFEGMANPLSPDPEGDHRADLRRLKAKVVALEHDAWYLPADFPRFHATLNAACSALLALGYAAIRRRLVRLHVVCMLAALALSAVFLTSYLYYHGAVRHGQPTSFAAQTTHASPPAWVGVVYQLVLWTHTPLAAVVTPLALYTAYQGLRGRLVRHVRLARWVLPVWLYVTVTGVVVYWMLYRLYPLP